MRAETGSGPPTPACWASMSMVSRGAGWNPECVCVGGGGGGEVEVEPTPGSECWAYREEWASRNWTIQSRRPR